MAFGESNRCSYIRGPDYRGGSTVNGQILMCDSNDIISDRSVITVTLSSTQTMTGNGLVTFLLCTFRKKIICSMLTLT